MERPKSRLEQAYESKPTVPPKDGFRSDDLRDILQCFPPQSLGNLGQTDALRICEHYSPSNLVAEDPVLLHQILISKQEFFV